MWFLAMPDDLVRGWGGVVRCVSAHQGPSECADMGTTKFLRKNVGVLLKVSAHFVGCGRLGFEVHG